MIVAAVETALGMALVYLLACLFTSSVNEGIAQRLGRRGRFLDMGLQRLIPEQPIYRRVLHHPLISALYRDRMATGRPPSYISPASFALALVDVVHARSFAIAGTPAPTTALDERTLRDAVIHLRPDHPRLAQSLLPILDRAGDDYGRALLGIEGWFSAGMDRVSGWYQERTRTILLRLGLLLAVAGNIDSIALARNFWATPTSWATVDRLAGQVSATTPDHLSSLPVMADAGQLVSAGMPIGYGCIVAGPDEQPAGVVARCRAAWKEQSTGDLVLKLLGWLLTGVAISLGSPFWFQAISRIVSLRAAGRVPSAD